MLPEVKRMVLPSGGESTASWLAINPLAPVRLSTMKFWPVLFWKATVSRRAWISVPPPGGNGTRMRTVLSGHCWAMACGGPTNHTADSAASAQACVLMESSSRRKPHQITASPRHCYSMIPGRVLRFLTNTRYPAPGLRRPLSPTAFGTSRRRNLRDEGPVTPRRRTRPLPSSHRPESEVNVPNIDKEQQPVTQITIVESEPEKQAEALSVMTQRAEFMANQPGCISISLHRSLDGRRIVNYIQWENRDQLRLAHQSAEFRREWDRF